MLYIACCCYFIKCRCDIDLCGILVMNVRTRLRQLHLILQEYFHLGWCKNCVFPQCLQTCWNFHVKVVFFLYALIHIDLDFFIWVTASKLFLTEICLQRSKDIFLQLLAHLSQRLIGELIGYSWSCIRPSVVRLSVVVYNFKHFLLQNRLLDQGQILCGASLGRANESLFAASGSHDQDGRQAHIR